MKWLWRGVKIAVVVAIPLLILVSVNRGFGLYVSAYNNIVNSYQNVNQAISNLDTEYQRRYALIDNFVVIVRETKGFEKYIMNFEKEAYSQVAEAKASATKMDLKLPDETKKRIAKEEGLGNILTNLVDKIAVFAQQYPVISDPNIKNHDKTFDALKDLKGELKVIEGDILVSRKDLNEKVKNYNVNIQVFPANVVAKIHNYKEISGFSVINTEAKNDSQIQF